MQWVLSWGEGHIALFVFLQSRGGCLCNCSWPLLVLPSLHQRSAIYICARSTEQYHGFCIRYNAELLLINNALIISNIESDNTSFLPTVYVQTMSRHLRMPPLVSQRSDNFDIVIFLQYPAVPRSISTYSGRVDAKQVYFVHECILSGDPAAVRTTKWNRSRPADCLLNGEGGKNGENGSKSGDVSEK